MQTVMDWYMIVDIVNYSKFLLKQTKEPENRWFVATKIVISE